MPQKASTRRVILQGVQKLMTELINLNEAAYRQGEALRLSDMSAADAKTAVEKTLDACGPLTVITGGTPWLISDNIGGILAGTINIDVSGTNTALSWLHAPES